jgi:hypothetical protein
MPATEQTQTRALDGAATGISEIKMLLLYLRILQHSSPNCNYFGFITREEQVFSFTYKDNDMIFTV